MMFSSQSVNLPPFKPQVTIVEQSKFHQVLCKNNVPKCNEVKVFFNPKDLALILSDELNPTQPNDQAKIVHELTRELFYKHNKLKPQDTCKKVFEVAATADLVTRRYILEARQQLKLKYPNKTTPEIEALIPEAEGSFFVFCGDRPDSKIPDMKDKNWI